MQQWEYYILTLEIDWEKFDANEEYGLTQGEITKLGNKGWELVGVAPLHRSVSYGATQTVAIEYLFKRPKQEKAHPSKKVAPSPSRITSDDIALLQSYADRHPESEIATSGIVGRLQSALKKNGSTHFAPISAEDVAFIQSYVDRHPQSELASSGILRRLQEGAK